MRIRFTYADVIFLNETKLIFEIYWIFVLSAISLHLNMLQFLNNCDASVPEGFQNSGTMDFDTKNKILISILNLHSRGLEIGQLNRK